MRSLFCSILIILVLSCHPGKEHHQVESTTDTVIKPDTAKQIHQLTEPRFSSDYPDYPDDYPQPANISFDPEELKKLDYGTDSLDGAKVLLQLFQGKINQKYLDFNWDYGVAYWHCSTCPHYVFQDENGLFVGDEPEKVTLPFHKNYTVFLYKIDYVDSEGVTCCLMSFSTSADFPPCGRFSSGLLSLALFKKTDRWRLVTFNPFVDFQGTFSTAHVPDTVIKLGGPNVLFLMKGGHANGPACDDYTPITRNLYLYSGLSCKELLRIREAYCKNNGYNFGSKWKSEIETTPVSSDTTGIKITLSGLIDKKNVWCFPDAFRDIEQPIYKKLPTKFRFEIVYHYNYTSDSILLLNDEMKLLYKRNGKDTVQVIN